MKRLIILLFSIVMAGEKTVDGNLKVTGSVESVQYHLTLLVVPYVHL